MLNFAFDLKCGHIKKSKLATLFHMHAFLSFSKLNRGHALSLTLKIDCFSGSILCRGEF